MTEFTVDLPDDIWKRLRCAAERQHIPAEELARTAIENFLDDYEPTKEEILDDLRQGMRDALAGRTRPAREVLDELRRELGKLEM
jgi:predicted transcriptional regulator